MAVPLPDEHTVNLVPPDRDETELMAAGVATAGAAPGGLTEVQRAVVNATVESMSGYVLDVSGLHPLGPDEFAEAMRRRKLAFRERMVQLMLLIELLLNPLPPEVTDRVEQYADALGVHEDMLRVAHQIVTRLARSRAHRLPAQRLLREDARAPARPPPHRSARSPTRGRACADDPALAARWSALGDCPEGSLGLGVWRFYRARGFSFPGEPGSAPPTLAQHDWMHVLADFGSTVECEIEVFGFISRANDDPAGFSLLAMVLGLFETGYLFNAAKGFFEYDRGHFSRDAEHMAVRLADAMARGARAAWCLDDHGRHAEIDFLGDRLVRVRGLAGQGGPPHFGVPAKSAEGDRLRVGHAVGAGRDLAVPVRARPGGRRGEGEEYDSYGAVPTRDA